MVLDTWQCRVLRAACQHGLGASTGAEEARGGASAGGLDLLRPQKADYPAKPPELTFQIPDSASLSQ